VQPTVEAGQYLPFDDTDDQTACAFCVRRPVVNITKTAAVHHAGGGFRPGDRFRSYLVVRQPVIGSCILTQNRRSAGAEPFCCKFAEHCDMSDINTCESKLAARGPEAFKLC